MNKKIRIILFISVAFLSQGLNAQTWEKNKRMTWNSGASTGPIISVDSSDIVYIAWSDATMGNTEIFFKKSNDTGSTWTSAKRLTWNSGESIISKMAIDSSDSIHLVWFDSSPGFYQIFYRKSTDGGSTWPSPKQLTLSTSNSRSPKIAVDSSDNLHIVYKDDVSGGYDQYYIRSTDGGSTWTSAKRMTWSLGMSFGNDIAIDSSDNIHVFWDNAADIHFKKSTDGGATWVSTKRLTWSNGMSSSPYVSVNSGSKIYFVWHYYYQYIRDQVGFKKSTDGGATWGTARRISWGSAAYSPKIAVDSNGYLHLVWNEWADWRPGLGEVYYKMSTNEGVTWINTKRLTWSPGETYSPNISIDSANRIHLVWPDETPGNAEIYYKKGIQ